MVVYNPYWYNQPFHWLHLIKNPEHKIMVVRMAVEFMPGRKTDELAGFLGWSSTTFARWAEAADEMGLLDIKWHRHGWYVWKTYHLPQDETR